MHATTRIGLIGLVMLLPLVAASPAKAAEQDPLNRNYNDHIAYVASFMLPTLAPRCEAAFPGYTARTSPVFLRWLASNEEQIERGRLLTMSEMKADQSLRAYRQALIDSRGRQLDEADAKGKQRVCDGIAGFIGGMTLPGRWP